MYEDPESMLILVAQLQSDLRAENGRQLPSGSNQARLLRWLRKPSGDAAEVPSRR